MKSKYSMKGTSDALCADATNPNEDFKDNLATKKKKKKKKPYMIDALA